MDLDFCIIRRVSELTLFDVSLRRIFSTDFRKGYDGLTVEQRRDLFGDEEDAAKDENLAQIQLYADGEDLTDYQVEAVVDEDQL